MKKIVLLAVALLFVSSMVLAGPVGYMGLYVDDLHSVCEIINPGGFLPFDMWIWCLPSDLGMMCSEFMLAYPPNIIQSTVTWNDPIISVKMGDLPSGLSVCYVACMYGWTMLCHQMCYLTDTAPGYIEIVGHPDVGVYQFANCEEGFPTEPILILNHLALNQPCIIGTEESSWGAIKSMLE